MKFINVKSKFAAVIASTAAFSLPALAEGDTASFTPEVDLTPVGALIATLGVVLIGIWLSKRGLAMVKYLVGKS